LFAAHREAAALPPEWQDKVLDQATKEGLGTRVIGEAVKLDTRRQ
jgi:hypothetical protein